MLGKLVPYPCFSMSMAAFLFAILCWVFFVPIRGSLLALFVSAFFYIFALASLGLLVSTKAQTQNEAMQMSMTVLLPSIFFSGFIFPRETMPGIFYAVSTLLPATYFIELMRAIVLRGATVADFWFNLAVLAAMGLLLFSWCAQRYRRHLT